MDEAFGLLDARFEPLGVIDVSLENARGHVLAVDVVCAEGHPPFSRSAMDGYAVRTEDIPAAEVKLKLAGTVRAGSRSEGGLAPGTCIKIMTGAPIPEGADSVVIQEDTAREEGFVGFNKPARRGQNIRYAGEDIRAGDVACPKGAFLGPAAVGTCALVGATTLSVFRKPAVSIIVTGDEITEPDNPEPPPGFIRNSNGPMLLSLLGGMGIEGRFLGIVPDDTEKLRAAFEEGLESDLMLVTGGVSVGQFDYVTDVLAKLGLEYLYRKVKVKPGKPVNFADGEKGKVFGLPGNPVSVLTSFHLFVKPMLKRMMGWDMIRPIYEGRLTCELMPDGERTLIAPCRCAFSDSRFELAPVRLNGSADLVGASRASCLAIVPAGGQPLKKGERLTFIMMEQRD